MYFLVLERKPHLENGAFFDLIIRQLLGEYLSNLSYSCLGVFSLRSKEPGWWHQHRNFNKAIPTFGWNWLFHLLLT